MSMHVWIGQFSHAAPSDYFEEVYSEDDDQPITKFAGEQGEIWLDHDWIELYRVDQPVSISSLIEGMQNSIKEQISARAQELDVSKANVLVTVLADEVNISSPQSVYRNEYTLHYLGLFETPPEEISIDKLTQAAKQGDSKSQYMLGQLFLFPPPDMKDLVDPEKSEYWLLKAAEQGETATYSRLYQLYSKYMTSGLDLKKAAYWVEKAAMEGNATDQYYAAECYAKGEGIPVDNVKAMQWYFLYACQNERQQSIDMINALKIKLTANELKQAERLALDWIEKYGDLKPLFMGMLRNPLVDIEAKIEGK